MEHALSLARLAQGHSSPNPAVGAVVVKEDLPAGEGYTQPAGSWHAEVVALNQAGEKARGGVLYVTLEPCCHYGRTPPCTQTIIDAGIVEVHLATIDPNPLVSGRGKAELEGAGIKVRLGEHEKAAQEINEAYTKFITTGLPFVTAKFAMSLDGKIATRFGDSKWISSEEARRQVHNLRYVVDAIMIGVNTVMADDPQLTSRCCGGRGGRAMKQPLRVIIDSKGRTPPSAQIFHAPGNTFLATACSLEPEKKEALIQAGAEVLEMPAPDGSVDLKGLLKALGEREITSILVEGGSTVFGSLFDQGLVDKVIVFIAPIIIGGREAKGAVEGLGASKVAEALRLHPTEIGRVGQDVMISGYVEGGSVHWHR
jgi:diaminohydroxyphosphoribosylaminopyrimidine deaminase/5-amino-6-(5-phosphoribosylamino)uracil reductase